jgi:hypothetical protein
VQPLSGLWREYNVSYVCGICEGKGDASCWVCAEGGEKAPAFEHCMRGGVAGYGC